MPKKIKSGNKKKGDAIDLIQVEVKAVYKGAKSKKGTYFPYNIAPNDYGIVGAVYIPVGKEVPHEVIVKTDKPRTFGE